MLFLAAL